jgi:hypothetical protein
MRRQQTILRRVTRVGLGMLVWVGLVGFLGGLVVIEMPSWVGTSIQLPLGDPESIAVDRGGRIYLALGFYGRVQQYDADGYFLRNWPVDSSGGAFAVAIDPASDNLIVTIARGHRQFTFSHDGRSLNTVDVPVMTPSRGPDSIVAPNGDRLEIRNGIIYPHVVRVDRNGVASQMIIPTPWWKWPITGPLPSWACMMVSMVMLGGVRRRGAAVKPKPPKSRATSPA